MLKKQKVYKVELKRRLGDPDNLVGGLIWEADWEDITEYFHERLTTVSTSLEDATLQGRLEQTSTTFRLDNVSGKFNPETVAGSLWETSGYIYHSRIRFWEYYQDEDAEDTEGLPLIDGLIGTGIKYREGMLVDVIVNSKLDVLREHYLLDSLFARTYATDSQAIMKKIIDLFDNTYSELGVTTVGSIFKNNTILDNSTNYSRSLLNLFYDIIGTENIGGLRRDGKLFATYVGAETVEQSNFVEDGDTVGLWHFTEGTGTTIADSTISSYDLSMDNTATNAVGDTIADTWAEGFFTYGASNFYRVFSPAISLSDYTAHILCRINFNRLMPSYPLNFLNVSVSGAWASARASDYATQHALNPIFMWTDYTYGTPNTYSQVLPSNADSSPSNQYFCEGFTVDYLGDLYYVNASSQSPNDGGYLGLLKDYTIIHKQKLGSLLGENNYFVLSVGIDDANEYVYAYVNGKLLSKIFVPSGVLNSVTKNKLVGCLFSSLGGSSGRGYSYSIGPPTNSTFDLGQIYYSGMKLNDDFPANFGDEAFDNYVQIFGTDFVL